MGCVPSTHLQCPHLSLGVHDAGLAAAGAQQVLPQVTARLLEALPRSKSSIRATESTRSTGKGEIHRAGSSVQCLEHYEPFESRRGAERWLL